MTSPRTPLVATYEVHMLRTDAEREEAAALGQDRQRWVVTRGLPVPTRADIPALFHDPQSQPAGLSECGELMACMVPQCAPSLRWGRGPCLFEASAAHWAESAPSTVGGSRG